MANSSPQDTSNQIEDAGEFIPGAVKHAYSTNHAKAQKSIKLKDLWPEPDWGEAVVYGGAPENILLFYGIYKSIRTTPPPLKKFQHFYSAEQLNEMYVTAIHKARKLFYFASKRKDIITPDKLMDVWYREYGLDPQKVRNNTYNFYFEELLPIHALGRGNGSTLKPLSSVHWVYSQLLKHGLAMGFPDDIRVLNYKVFPLSLKNRRTGERFYKVAEFKANEAQHMSDEKYHDLKEALNAAKAINQDRLKRTPGGSSGNGRGYFYKKSRDNLKPGELARLKRDLTPEDHIKYFGLRGLQFGNAMSNAEKQRWLNYVGLALIDLGRIIGLARSEMNRLSAGGAAFSYGARGRGGASAHYEPGQRVINLTRQSGPSAIAHEWAHLLDHFLSEKTDVRVTGQRNYLSQEVFSLGTHINDVYPSPSPLARSFSQLMSTIKKSDFYQAAKRIQGQKGAKTGYWTDPCELFARAFESYVEDKLEQMGVINEWLVAGTTGVSLPPEHQNKNPYPCGSDRKQLFQCFEQLMPLVRQLLITQAVKN